MAVTGMNHVGAKVEIDFDAGEPAPPV